MEQTNSIRQKKVHTAQGWDEYAEVWKEELEQQMAYKDSTDTRIAFVTEFLSDRGLLGGDMDVIDVGSGPCCFSAAFAKTARHVTATDISPKMLEYGEQRCLEMGLKNLDYKVCDFTNADLSSLGWEKRFDLAYASITPALSGENGLKNFIGMSRAFCCNTAFVLYKSGLEAQAREMLGLDPAHPFWDGHQFREFWNRLYSMGYLPEVKFHCHKGKETQRVTQKLAGTLAFWCADGMAPEPEMTKRIFDFLLLKSNNGILENDIEVWYATTLWDTRIVQPRW